MRESVYESLMCEALAEGQTYCETHGHWNHRLCEQDHCELGGHLRGCGSGWILTGSWPIDTEMKPSSARPSPPCFFGPSGVSPAGESRLVMRNEIGDWRDVSQELPNRIHEWMPRLRNEGVVGADAIFACLGPALEIFSRYSRVEKASGESFPSKST